MKLKNEDFIGRDACLSLRNKPLKKKICCMTFDESGIALGYEAIFAGARCIGHVTSANYGYAIGKFILYGYLPLDYAREGTQLEVEYCGERYPATVVSEPLYDRDMARLRA